MDGLSTRDVRIRSTRVKQNHNRQGAKVAKERLKRQNRTDPVETLSRNSGIIRNFGCWHSLTALRSSRLRGSFLVD